MGTKLTLPLRPESHSGPPIIATQTTGEGHSKEKHAKEKHAKAKQGIGERNRGLTHRPWRLMRQPSPPSTEVQNPQEKGEQICREKRKNGQLSILTWNPNLFPFVSDCSACAWLESLTPVCPDPCRENSSQPGWGGLAQGRLRRPWRPVGVISCPPRPSI